jgi:hypothetical protein
MIDAIELLLQNRQHPTAQKLLEFHRANPAFFSDFAAEFFWLKKRGRPGAAKSLLMFLRGTKHWQGVDAYMVPNTIFPLLSRVCILLYPALNNGTLELRQCEADEILGTKVTPSSRKNKGTILHASEALQLELSQLPPMPAVREINRRSTRRRTVKPEQAAYVFPYIKELVAASPHPRSRVLRLLLRHAKTQPEIFALAEMTAKARLTKGLHAFSVLDIFTYSKQTAQRAADRGKMFTLSGKIAALYCRAFIKRNPQFNGWTAFSEDSHGKHKGYANALLGCHLAPEPVNGEPYRRLLWGQQ